MRIIKMSKSGKGAMLIILAGCLWGLVGPIVTQMEAAGSTPAMTSFLRMAFAAIVLFVISIIRFGPSSLKVGFRTLVLCALLGLICQASCNLFYTTSVLKAGVALSAILVRLSPVFTLVAAFLIFSEKTSFLKITAAAINIIGCALCAYSGLSGNGEASTIGIVCGIGSAFCYGMAPILSKLATEGNNVFIINFYSYLFASVPLFPIAHPWVGITINTQIILWGFALGLFTSAIGYTLYYAGVNMLEETGKAPIFASSEAVTAVILGVALSGEKLGVLGVSGTILALASIALMSINKHADCYNFASKSFIRKIGQSYETRTRRIHQHHQGTGR